MLWNVSAHQSETADGTRLPDLSQTADVHDEDEEREGMKYFCELFFASKGKPMIAIVYRRSGVRIYEAETIREANKIIAELEK